MTDTTQALNGTRKGVIIMGSARSDGNTRSIVESLAKKTGYKVVDLNDWEIGFFDYDAQDRKDGFVPLMRELLEHDLLVFATPVYWYSMSGIMKNFFDRITDLLHWHKPLGRQLRGKTMAIISCGSDAHVEQAFAMPFEKSAAYLGMRYKGHMHTWKDGVQIIPEVKERISTFATTLAD